MYVFSSHPRQFAWLVWSETAPELSGHDQRGPVKFSGQRIGESDRFQVKQSAGAVKEFELRTGDPGRVGFQAGAVVQSELLVHFAAEQENILLDGAGEGVGADAVVGKDPDGGGVRNNLAAQNDAFQAHGHEL